MEKDCLRPHGCYPLDRRVLQYSSQGTSAYLRVEPVMQYPDLKSLITIYSKIFLCEEHEKKKSFWFNYSLTLVPMATVGLLY